MPYFTTSIALVAGLCLAFGILYLFIGARRPSDRTLNLHFALFSLFYAGAIMTARSSFMADTLDEYASANRISGVFAALGFIAFLWFVAAYTGVRPRSFLWAATAAFAIYGLAGIIAPDLVVNITQGVESVTLPWNETLLMLPNQDSALLPLLSVAVIATIGYVVVADVKQFRSGERNAALALAIGIGWFFFTVLEELAVQLTALDFVVLSDFGFLGFVVAMSLQMVNNAIETETELVNYRSNLESMVNERSMQLEEAQAQLLSQAEEQATTAERSRLARELHDVVTQLLFSINLVAGSLPQLWERDPDMARRSTAELQRLTRGALAEMRTLLRELRPQTITETDLALLVTHLSDGLAARHDIPAEVRVETAGSLPPDVHMAIYRIAQEAMSNIAKHANASSLTVTLVGTDSRVDLSVVDDGYGFDRTDIPAGAMGLDIMQERADAIGAELVVASQPDIGTRVDVAWHYEPSREPS
ncbi:MAG: sensor histidine kinase [Acidimicrobiia bacterium]